MPTKRTQVLRLDGEIVLDWGNGIRLRIGPADVGATSRRSGSRKAAATGQGGGTRGRKPSPATQALKQALEEDEAAGRVRDRAEYLEILRSAGHKASATSANLILAREAKRVFGRPLPRAGSADGRGPGRQPSHETTLLRERLASDQAKGKLRDASTYVKWLVDQPGVKAGLKQVRPIVYRELRKAGA